MQLLNVGCGRCYHPSWTNVDLVAAGPGVQACDITRGLPFSENTFDAVYHSHVLEHLEPQDAGRMLRECFRVLKPGGVLRIAVPDLEGIARQYLQSLDAAIDQSSETAVANHEWMTLEMIDQLTRSRGGGQMSVAIKDSESVNRDFIESRIGHQVTGNQKTKAKKTAWQRIRKAVAGIRKQMALTAVTMIEGPLGRKAYREGRFRQSGEVHRWMYDRASLARLLNEIGLEAPTVCDAAISRIADFDDYQLDRDGQSARKPDSLYMEAIKPLSAMVKNQTAPSAKAA